MIGAKVANLQSRIIDVRQEEEVSLKGPLSMDSVTVMYTGKKHKERLEEWLKQKGLSHITVKTSTALDTMK